MIITTVCDCGRIIIIIIINSQSSSLLSTSSTSLQCIYYRMNTGALQLSIEHKIRSQKSLQFKSYSSFMSSALFSELRWVWHGAQIFGYRQCVPCGETGAWERTIIELSARPWQREVHRRRRPKPGTPTDSRQCSRENSDLLWNAPVIHGDDVFRPLKLCAPCRSAATLPYDTNASTAVFGTRFCSLSETPHKHVELVQHLDMTLTPSPSFGDM